MLAMRLSRASVLLSKLLLWSPDIDGESGAVEIPQLAKGRKPVTYAGFRGKKREPG